ncbi:MAG TPA: hypothetical protein VFV57_07700 [Limnobacter sp.]|nr:hypothetical protein [Limnobacter sp.]
MQFDTPYRAEIPFKNFANFLERPVTLVHRNGSSSVRLSLQELLKTLDLKQGALKGSTACNWRQPGVQSDIDLQFHQDTTTSLEHIPNKILEFLARRRGETELVNRSTIDWLPKVAHELTAAWNRLIVRIGYPRPGGCTLDLNFTSDRRISHDAIHASRAIEFDLALNKAYMMDAWHPSLVEWMQKHGLLWFNPNIEDGLSRLSYRLSKTPAGQLLQPTIGQTWFDQAEPALVSNVHLRILADEYPSSALHAGQRAQIWVPIVEAAQENADGDLLRELLAWSKLGSASQLLKALNDVEVRECTVTHLTQGCKVGHDFKKSLRATILAQPGLSQALRPLIAQALGATLVDEKKLFAALDQWKNIDDVPEHELGKVFTAYFEAVAQNKDSDFAQRATHALGWLANAPLASLQFWLDRVPTTHNTRSPEAANQQIVEATLKVIEQQGVMALEPAIDRLSKLNFTVDDWHLMIESIQNCEIPFQCSPNDSIQSPVLEFLSLLADQSTVMFTERTNVRPHNQQGSFEVFGQTFTRFQRLGSQLLAQKVPPMLREIFALSGDQVNMTLPQLQLVITPAQHQLEISYPNKTQWISDNLYATLTKETTSEERMLEIVWRDQTVFEGKRNSSSRVGFQGLLCPLTNTPPPKGLEGLLQAGWDLCESHGLGEPFVHQGWVGQGLFLQDKLLQAKTGVEALKAMREGSIMNNSINVLLAIEHPIANHMPIECCVHQRIDNGTHRLSLKYVPARKMHEALDRHQNVWKVVPDFAHVDAISLVDVPALGLVEVKHMPHLKSLQSTTPNPFLWEGEMEDGRLLQAGKLFIGRQKSPAVVFDESSDPEPLPVGLLPVMAEILGKGFHGKYAFRGRVWENAHVWPSAGFEGFLNRQRCGDYFFSGYLTATGRALGILDRKAGPEHTLDQAWLGSFRVLQRPLLKMQTARLDEQRPDRMHVPVSNTEVLVPHGLVREHLMHPASDTSHVRIERVYFCGEGWSYGQITQSAHLIYDSPNMQRYLAGAGYTQNKTSMQIDLVLNPNDGGDDYLFVRPVGYEKMTNSHTLYFDAQGTQASLLAVNREFKMGTITFPSGLVYRGELQMNERFFVLTGQGKFTWKNMDLKAKIGVGGRLESLQGANDAAHAWIKAFVPAHGKPNFDVQGLPELLSGGEINWQNDIQPYLMVRQLKELRSSATIFTRPR